MSGGMRSRTNDPNNCRQITGNYFQPQGSLFMSHNFPPNLNLNIPSDPAGSKKLQKAFERSTCVRHRPPPPPYTCNHSPKAVKEAKKKWGGGSGSAAFPGVQSIIMDVLISFLGITKGVQLGPPRSPCPTRTSANTPWSFRTSSFTSVSGLG